MLKYITCQLMNQFRKIRFTKQSNGWNTLLNLLKIYKEFYSIIENYTNNSWKFNVNKKKLKMMWK